MQEYILGPGKCNWFDVEDQNVTHTIKLRYKVPVLGQIFVWFAHEVTVAELSEDCKAHWQLPVKYLLKIAKVTCSLAL